MFSFNIKDLETNLAVNFSISKKIEIDENLNCFIIIDSNNKKIVTPLLNKIVDLVLDNIDCKDTYTKFSVTLENINFFIKTLKNKENNLDELNIIIWILEKNNFHFSKIWKASCFLKNKKNEIIEISDKNIKIDTFDFISSWKLTINDKIILSNISLWDILTQWDLLDIWKQDENEKINENIINILNDEKFESNVSLITIKFEDYFWETQKNKIIEKIWNLFYKIFDNNFSKKTIAFYMLLKWKIEQKWKIVKNIIFFSWILLSTILLYLIISWIIWKSSEISKNAEYKENLIKAREYIRIANQNIANPEAFTLNIKKAEELINIVKKQELFLNDIEWIFNDISIIKKQFNWIEIFDSNIDNLIFRWNFKDSIKLLELNKKLYVLWKSSVYWPIISWREIKNNIFNELAIDDNFVDWISNWDEIIITTQKSRVIRFLKDWSFKYVNVLWQKTWQWSKIVESYNWNIYMTNKESNQIYKHVPSLGSFMAWIKYLNEWDSKNIWEILSIWIDWWIYILNKELKLFKFFSYPKYKLESIILNKLPENYKFEWNKNIHLITKNNLNYVYLFLNKKIWIFQPNTRIFSDTKNLTYKWQIEWKNEIIKWFYIPRDWEINVLTDNWIYKILFEIKDEKIILR